MPFKYNALLGLGLDNTIPLDGTGKIPSTFLPSYVDDVEEYNNLAAFPATGETGKIYVAIDTGFVYRWSGSIYVQIGVTAAAGSTTQVQFNDGGAFGGDAGLVFDKTTDALTIAGPVVHPLGAAATPSLTFTGDPNTGIYSPGADQVAISTNGTGRLFIDANGNVGASATPSAWNASWKVLEFANGHAFGSSGVQSAIAQNLFNNSGGSWIYKTSAAATFYQQNNGEYIWYTAASGTAGDTASLSERMRLTSTGLGVGVSAPGARLHVDSIGALASVPALGSTGGLFNATVGIGGYGLVSGALNSGAYFFQAQTTSGAGAAYPILLNPSGGSVGIGTSAPDVKTQIVKNALTKSWSADTDDILAVENSASANLDFRAGSSAATYLMFSDGDARARGYLAYSHSSDSLLFGAAGSERLRITSAGNVGIGTTSPSQALHVVSSVNQALFEGATQGNITIQKAGTAGMGLYSNAAGTLAFYDIAGAAERARIDSSGRLLVGTSTASNFVGTGQPATLQTQDTAGAFALGIEKTGNNGNPGNIAFRKTRSASSGGVTSVASGDEIGALGFYGTDGTGSISAARISVAVDGTPGTNDMPGRLVFSTTADGSASPTERMRIGSNGNTFVGTTAAAYAAGERLSISPNASSNAIGIALGNTNNVGIGLYHGYTATGSAIALQFQDHSAVVRGSITVTTSATAYNTSSDYRLKENVAAVTDGITRLQQLKPSRFNFTADPDKTVDGFIAHEAQAVVPECVTGEKDAMDDDGNPVYQGIDQSKLVPLLTAALQEAIAKIETLDARLTAAGIE